MKKRFKYEVIISTIIIEYYGYRIIFPGALDPLAF
jgi:hypothetical protein